MTESCIVTTPHGVRDGVSLRSAFFRQIGGCCAALLGVDAMNAKSRWRPVVSHRLTAVFFVEIRTVRLSDKKLEGCALALLFFYKILLSKG
jgi:hypothetical protein